MPFVEVWLWRDGSPQCSVYIPCGMLSIAIQQREGFGSRHVIRIDHTAESFVACDEFWPLLAERHGV